jgi:hypothetical protein
MTLETCADGKVPPFRFESVVRSEGGTFNAGTAGPEPFPSLPWQTAQYSENIA